MQFIDRVANVLPPLAVSQSKRTGTLFQRGVLRTNCIDCLDRTNGGQFAVAMRFLLISLQALGISSPNLLSLDLSKDPLLLSLMEMYGEMGDKIALQYGGSEAHKKVFAGKSVQQPNSSKQSELLTSIKRYYSNAFTDMVKQDAMNLFLGCFIPNESSVPLWDLESDYYLHNLELHPRAPKVYRVLYDDIVKDSDVIHHNQLKAKLESAIKKAFNEFQKIMEQADQSSNNKEDGDHGTVSISDSSKQAMKVDAAKVMIRYYIRNLALDRINQATTIPKSPSFTVDEHNLHYEAPEPIPSPLLQSPISKLKSRGVLNSTIRSIARLERRKLMRIIASKKIAASSQGWWKEPLADFLKSIELNDIPPRNKSRSSSSVNNSSKKEEKSDKNKKAAENDSTENSYYERFHKPYQLTEFDSLLAFDFFAVQDAVNVNNQELSKKKNNYRMSVDFDQEGDVIPAETSGPIVVPGTPGAGKTGGNGEGDAANGDGGVLPYGLSSLFSFYPTLANTIIDPAAAAGNGNGGTANGGALVVSTNGAGLSTPAKPYNYDASMSQLTYASTNPGGDSAYYTLDDDKNMTPSAGTGGFQITKYVREIGIKARTLVGGFLRKEESANTPNRGNNRLRTISDDAANGIKRNSEISLLNHSVSRASMSLYKRYRDAYDNRLVLTNTDGMKYTEEEYNALLKDCRIHVDDVKGMENLASEGYISHEINRGVFQGLSQNSSAILAYGFLFTTIVNVEQELEYFGNYVDQKANASRAVGYNIRSSQNENSTDMKVLHSMRKTSMIMSNEVQERIIKSILRSKIALGLEMELKKLINNYIFIQYQNAKELSFDRLARRVSPYTPERTILEYSSQFDYDILGSDIDTVAYIASSSPGYTSFRDFFNLRQTVEGNQQSYAKRKSKYLNEKAKEDNANDQKLSQENQDIQNLLHPSPPSGMTKTNSASSLDGLATSSGKNNSNTDLTTISSQLGLTSIDGLLEDLKTNYDLTSYGSYGYPQYPYGTEDTFDKNNYNHLFPDSSNSFAQISGVNMHNAAAVTKSNSKNLTNNQLHLYDYEYDGFIHLAPDLYSKMTNPHLQMNEIGVLRFKEALQAK